MKGVIKNKRGFNVFINHKNVSEPSWLFGCNKIEYMSHKVGKYFDHHLMFFSDGKLIFKVYLKNEEHDKEYKGINEALENVDIIVIKL